MLPNHYMDVALDNESVGYFSRSCDGQAIVFVHGFMGDKLTTWDKMHELLLLERAVANSDVVFYGYSSVQPQARVSALLLRQFLASISPMSTSMAAHLPPERRKLANHNYRKILVVAHSLGGAIARRAILDGHLEGDAWTQQVSLLLFAPAHCGAQLAELKKELAKTSKLVSWLSLLLTPASQSVLDLEPDSRFITALKTETAAELAKSPVDCLRARKVIFGQRDCVVVVDRFCGDPLETVWKGHNHNSVCKVSSKFTDPMQEVLIQL